MADEASSSNKNKLSLSVDLRVIIAILLVVIVAMFMVWKPWDSVSANDRTITVTGQSVVKSEPDEYVFYPTYQFKNTDSDAALAAMTKKSDAVVAGLKKIGVTDSQIKTNSGGYDYGYPVTISPENMQTTYTLSITVTVNSREMAQKVQDYLLTTSPTGNVSPMAQFSDAKRKELENQARDEATKDARAKAEQSADNIGFRIGRVKSVNDGSGFGDVFPLGREGGVATDSSAPQKQLAVHPGENDLNYSVTVVYYVR